MTLTVASLFSGVEGIGLAFERAGAQVVACVEIDKAARGVIADRMPHATLFSDVTKVTADDLRAAGFVPERGVLTAGFPCQDLSIAGRRRGMGEGTRSGLYWHVDRLMAELRPRWVFFENVPGILSAVCPCTGHGDCVANGRADECPNDGELHTIDGGACAGGCIASHGGAMGAVLGSMGHRGYGFAARVLDAQYFGVAQRRRRVFFVGHLGAPFAAAARVLLEPEGSTGDPAPGQPPRPHTPARTGEGAAGARDASGAGLANTLTTGSDGGRYDKQPMVVDRESFILEPETGQGADLRARPADLAPALTATSEAKATDRGVRIVETYRKSKRASNASDDETWLEDEVANTVNTHDIGDVRATELVVECVTGEIAHTLTGEGHDASEDGTGRGTPLVVDGYISSRLIRNSTTANEDGIKDGRLSDTLQGDGPGAVCITGVDTYNAEDTGDVAHTMPAGAGPGRMPHVRVDVAASVTAKWAKRSGGPAGDETQNLAPAEHTGGTVRRLTPLECERLQGFPDDWTVTSNGKAQADGPRYKQMGNSVAVPAVEWTARRLISVDALIHPAQEVSPL